MTQHGSCGVVGFPSFARDVKDLHDISRSTERLAQLFHFDWCESVHNQYNRVGINPDRREYLVLHIVKEVKDKELFLPLLI